MDFLNIAVDSSTKLESLPNWQLISLTNISNPASIAAFVVSKNNTAAISRIEKIKSESGLPIPVIKVKNEITDSERKKILSAANNYVTETVPTYLQDLVKFAKDKPVSFTTPGHHNGLYYEKHPAGVIMNKFFGKNLMYADTSDTVPELGDMMTHDGSPLTAEQKAAETYHADKVYFCTNGTTSANSICASAVLRKDDLVLFDRNNHKSLYNSALVMSGAKPVYIKTDRNPLGLIGEMDPECLTADYLRKEAAKIDPEKAKKKRPFRMAVVQAETYDGVFYDAKWIVDKIGNLCDYILFDCAWGGFEEFLPIMEHLSPLLLDLGPEDPGILVTQSLHKQQAGMAQASQILKKDSHIKGQERYVDHKHFNHAYLKFVTSSYSYPIYASLVANTYLVSGPGNKKWWNDTLRMGIELRKQLLAKSKLFKPLVCDNFAKIPTEDLMTNSKYWNLSPNASWHGFNRIAANEAMLDPMKITVITPGIDIPNSKYQADGIPGPVVAEFLMEKRIIRAKNDLNSLLFLLTPGDRQEDLDALVNAFLEFEKLYLEDAPLEKVVPKLAMQYPKRYQGYTLQKLCNEMHKYYASHQTFKLQKALFEKENMQSYTMIPAEADNLFMHNESKLVNLKDVVGEVAAEGALPYPPGVFIVAPGEKWQKVDQNYFEVLVGAMENFPGFVPEIQGVYWKQASNGKINVEVEVLK